MSAALAFSRTLHGRPEHFSSRGIISYSSADLLACFTLATVPATSPVRTPARSRGRSSRCVRTMSQNTRGHVFLLAAASPDPDPGRGGRRGLVPGNSRTIVNLPLGLREIGTL
jgi:hypothetical protein